MFVKKSQLRFVMPAALLLACGLCSANPFEGATVKDRGASFIDVKARQAFFKKGEFDARLKEALIEEYDCTKEETVEPPKGEMVIPRRYLSGNTGPVDPEYERVVQMYRDFEHTSSRLSNLYVQTSKPVYAACLVSFLDKWARAEAYLNYDPVKNSQSWYQTEWSASAAAMALSLVYNEPSLDTKKRDQIIDWLHRVATKQIGYPGGDTSCCNNHSYWRGQEATIIGILSGDNKMYQWGLGRYVQAIDLTYEDSSFVHEMTRKELSTHYQNYALLPLTMIAELALRQGVDLYSYKHEGRDIHSAVKFLFAALKDPALVKKYTPEEQNFKTFRPGSTETVWMEYQRERFGITPPANLVEKPLNSSRNGGSSTLLVYKPVAAK